MQMSNVYKMRKTRKGTKYLAILKLVMIMALTCIYPKKSVDRPVNDSTVSDRECAECKDSTDPIAVLWIVRLCGLIGGH
jgi:hypothetical protein